MGVNLTPGVISKISTGECTENDLKPVLQVTSTRHICVFDLNLLSTKCDIIGNPELLDDEILGFDLTPGAITNIVTGKCSSNDLKPVLQLINIDNRLESEIRMVVFSDGSFMHFGFIPCDILIPNKLQKGSVVQLTHFRPIDRYNRNGEISTKSVIQCYDLTVIRNKCGIIGDPKLLPDYETPLAQITTPTIPDEDHVKEPPTSKQKQDHVKEPATSKQKQDHVKETPTSKQKQDHVKEPATSKQKQDHVKEPPTSKQKQDHVKEPPTSKQKQDHVDSLLNEDIDDSHHVEDPSTSIQNPSTSTQKCSSHSPIQNKKRKLQSSDVIISGFGKDNTKLVSMIVEKTIEDGLGACYKKLGTLEEGVSKIMEKNKEVDMGFEKLKTLEENVSKLTRMIMEKNKEDVAGFKKLDTLEEHVSKMTQLMTEKSKEVDVDSKNLETLEQDVSIMTRMMMDKNKEDGVGASYKKLETLEKDISKLMKMTTDKNKEDVVGFKKLETLEANVSKMVEIMMDKNKEDDVGACFKKLETLEENVSKLTRMTMEKNIEDDMGACIEKLEKMGWGAQEPLYDTALLLFCQSADYRKLWLHLKPESCGKWVKNAGNMFGLLD